MKAPMYLALTVLAAVSAAASAGASPSASEQTLTAHGSDLTSPAEPTRLDALNRWKMLQQQSYASAKVGSFEQSLAQAQKALHVATSNFEPNSHNTATTLEHMGKLHLTLGDTTQAKHYYKKSLAIETAIAQRNKRKHPELARSQLGLGLVYNQENDGKSALPLIKSAYAIFSNNGFFKENDPNKAKVLFELAKSHYLVGDLPAAKTLHQDSLAIRRQVFGAQHADVSESLNELAMLHYKLAEYAQAESLMEESLAIAQRTYGENHAQTYVLMRNMLTLYQKSGNTIKEKKLCQQSYAVWRANQGRVPKPQCH